MSGGLTEQELLASDDAVIQAVCRLFSVMEQGVPSEFIRKNAVQEMIYHALCGSSGRQFIQSIVNIQRVDEIYQANSWIKESFREFFSVEELEEQQNASVEELLEAAGIPLGEDGEPETGADVMDIQTERSMELRKDIRQFVDENPEIAATMIKNWLKGDDDNG